MIKVGFLFGFGARKSGIHVSQSHEESLELVQVFLLLSSRITSIKWNGFLHISTGNVSSGNIKNYLLAVVRLGLIQKPEHTNPTICPIISSL